MSISLSKICFVTILCLLAVVVIIPSLLSEQMLEKLPNWLSSQQINLGLDLKGGCHIVMEVETEAATDQETKNLERIVRNIIRGQGYKYLSIVLSNDIVVVTVKNQSTEDLRMIQNNLEVQTKKMGYDVIVTCHSNQSHDTDQPVVSTISITTAAVAAKKNVGKLVKKTIEIIERRINSTGAKELNIQPIGVNRIMLQIPGVFDITEIKTMLSTVARLTFHTEAEHSTDSEAVGYKTLPVVGDDGSSSTRSVTIDETVALGGEHVTDATLSYDSHQEPCVSIEFDAIGAEKFGTLTMNNIGKRIAIVLDNKIISDPKVNMAIMNGNCIITGNFTVEKAAEMALLLRSGSLPATVKIVEERIVGAEIGADSINDGVKASAIGIGGVLVFMIVIYSWFGLMADIAVIVNLLLTFAVMILMGITLTLPGLAGMALSVGMAVDANILINERIKDEIRRGAATLVAIKNGYKAAMPTVLDTNVNTLIGMICLYSLSSGSIKGFAITTIVGVLISFFTATVVTNMLIGIITYQKAKTA